MPYLNGKLVTPEAIDPAKHKFIGTFRPPEFRPSGNVMCTCGSILEFVRETQEHWRAGHMDEPQYVDI